MYPFLNLLYRNSVAPIDNSGVCESILTFLGLQLRTSQLTGWQDQKEKSGESQRNEGNPSSEKHGSEKKPCRDNEKQKPEKK